MTEDLRKTDRRRVGKSRRSLARERRHRSCAKRCARRSTLLDAGKLRVAEKIDGAWVTHQWAKKAVLLSFRLEDNEVMRGRLHALLRQGAVQVRGLRPRRRSRQAASGSCRPRRSATAPTSRETSCSCRPSSTSAPTWTKARWWIPGRPSAPARRSAGTCTSRAASASAACSSRCRRIRPSSRTTASSARAPRSSKGVIVEEGCVISMGVFIGASTKIYQPRHRRGPLRARPAGFGRRSGLLAVRRRALQPLLRGDRQAGGRQDARQDEHQRAAPQLIKHRFVLQVAPLGASLGTIAAPCACPAL